MYYSNRTIRCEPLLSGRHVLDRRGGGGARSTRPSVETIGQHAVMTRRAAARRLCRLADSY